METQIFTPIDYKELKPLVTTTTERDVYKELYKMPSSKQVSLEIGKRLKSDVIKTHLPIGISERDGAIKGIEYKSGFILATLAEPTDKIAFARFVYDYVSSNLSDVEIFIVTEENSPLSTFDNVITTTFYEKYSTKAEAEAVFNAWIEKLISTVKKRQVILIGDGLIDMVGRCENDTKGRPSPASLAQFVLDEIRKTNSNLFVLVNELYNTLKSNNMRVNCQKLISELTVRGNLLVSCNPALYNNDFQIRLPNYDLSDGSAILCIGGRNELVRYGRYE